MRDKVLRRCRESALFSPGDAVVCALSGGADSAAMLRCLLSLRGELGISVSAAHFNHCLRGAESDRDEAFCRSLCGSLGVPLAVGRGDAAARARERGESVEQAARELRYEFLLALPADRIATAHTADDNLETILMNLTRGTGLRGLAGIPPVRGRIVRPLLDVSRAEILSYLAETGVPHVEDSTNAGDDCLRNRLRHGVVPLLRAENPSLAADAAALAGRLRADEEFLEETAGALLASAATGGGWEIAPLRAAPEPLRARACARLLALCGLTRPTAGHVKAVGDVLFSESPSARCSLPGGAAVYRRYGLIFAGRETPAAPWEPVLLPLPGEARLPGAGLRVVCEGPTAAGRSAPALFYLRCGAVSGALLLRPRREGDVLRLPGGSKRLSRLMIDRKIPADRRNALPVFEAEGRVAAAALVGADEGFLARPGEAAYRMEVLEDREEGSHD